ncbi:MAG: MBL fold metallo-hydrolase [candidate division KSB1 bacterium]|nr:MBL fold metallo-hydrolase [candidate division KSB1 bacterium]MDZ7367006.1 MBL fold metallo-hydrolase [candidate division KSB1 bacterium]
MKTKIFSLVIALMLLISSAASAQSKLQLTVITSSPAGFWVNSALVSGEKDALLIDAQFTLSDAHRVAAAILESRKNLTFIYITHWHPDHYFGLNVLKQAFPNARIVALPATVEDIKQGWETKVKQWKPMYGDNLTSAPVIPEPLQGTTLTLEGETLQIVGPLQGDDKNNSYVLIPSLKAVVCGDIVFDGIFPWTLETTPAERKDWIAVLDKIAALKPSIVVAGHKTPELKDDPSSLQFTKNYLIYYDEALTSSKSSEEFQSKVKSKFPGLGLDLILKLASDAAFSNQKK